MVLLIAEYQIKGKLALAKFFFSRLPVYRFRIKLLSIILRKRKNISDENTSKFFLKNNNLLILLN